MPVKKTAEKKGQNARGFPDYQTLFEYAPVALWEQDFSKIKQYLDELKKKNVRDLRSYFTRHPHEVTECMKMIHSERLNIQTLLLYGAESEEHLLLNLDNIFRDEMRELFADELMAIWNGNLHFQREGVNYALDGSRLDISLSFTVLPGSEETFERVLLFLADITPNRRAVSKMEQSEAKYRGLFENAPISLWEEDYSLVKQYLTELKEKGVEDLRGFLENNPQAVEECMGLIRVIDINQKTLEMFCARSKVELLSNLNRIFRDDMRTHFTDELVDMWEGHLHYEREGLNYALNGNVLDIQLYWSVFPGYEETLGRVLVSLVDITARKKAEGYLKYLGTHDVLTGLYDRAYFEEERNRLEKGRRFPVSIIVIDLDGLKEVNDTQGHAQGDELIRRAAEVFRTAFRAEDVVARIGGDEFAVLMPETDEAAASMAVQRIQSLVRLNNTFYPGVELSLSLGYNTGTKSSSLIETQRKADNHMYAQKQAKKRKRSSSNEQMLG